jgi:hypothetical protein
MKTKKSEIEEPIPDPRENEARAAVRAHFQAKQGDPVGVARRKHYVNFKNPLLYPSEIVLPGALVQMPENLFKEGFYNFLLDPRDLPEHFISYHDFRYVKSDGGFEYVLAKTILAFDDAEREECLRLWRSGFISPITETTEDAEV